MCELLSGEETEVNTQPHNTDEIEAYVSEKVESVVHCDGCPYGQCDGNCESESCDRREADLRRQFREEFANQKHVVEHGE